MRILIVEDSERLRESLVLGLRRTGYAVDETADGRHGLWLAQTHPYDLIILDLMLPSMDGLSVLQSLREEKCDTHVLILTAKDRVEDKVRGLRAGADDYLVKPFAFDELLARIEALLRRQAGVKSNVIQIESLRLDTAARTVLWRGDRLELSPREYSVLEYLARHCGQAVTRAEIEAHIYDERAELMSNVVDTVIYALRKKLDPRGGESLIRTRRGMGYIIEESAT